MSEAWTSHEKPAVHIQDWRLRVTDYESILLSELVVSSPQRMASLAPSLPPATASESMAQVFSETLSNRVPE